MSKRPTSVCSRGSASAGGSPQRRISTASSSVSPSGDESSGGFGSSVSAASRAASGLRRAPARPAGAAPSRRAAPRAAPATASPSASSATRSSSTRGTSSRQRSSAASQASNASAAPLRARRRRYSSGVVAGCAGVDHDSECTKASSRAATPSSSTERDDEVGAGEDLGVRVRDGDREAGPVEQLAVVLAVAAGDRLRRAEAEPVGDELEPRALAHVRVRELEEVRQRLRDEEASGEARLQHGLERVHLRRRRRRPRASSGRGRARPAGRRPRGSRSAGSRRRPAPPASPPRRRGGRRGSS